MIRKALTAGLSGVFKLWVNDQYARYGQMLNIQIDTNNHKIDAVVLPKGENASITIQAQYRVIRGATTEVQLSGITTSREWINVVLHETGMDNQNIPMSGIAAKFLEQLL